MSGSPLLHSRSSSSSSTSSSTKYTTLDYFTLLDDAASILTPLVSALYTWTTIVGALHKLEVNATAAHHALWLLVFETVACILSIAHVRVKHLGSQASVLMSAVVGFVQLLVLVFTGHLVAAYGDELNEWSDAWLFVFYLWPIFVGAVLRLTSPHPVVLLVMVVFPYLLAAGDAAFMMVTNHATLATLAKATMPARAAPIFAIAFYVSKGLSFFLSTLRYLVKLVWKRKLKQLLETLELFMQVARIKVLFEFVQSLPGQLPDDMQKDLDEKERLLARLLELLHERLQELLFALFGTTRSTEVKEYSDTARAGAHWLPTLIGWVLWIAAVVYLFMAGHKFDHTTLACFPDCAMSNSTYTAAITLAGLLHATPAVYLAIFVMPFFFSISGAPRMMMDKCTGALSFVIVLLSAAVALVNYRLYDVLGDDETAPLTDDDRAARKMIYIAAGISGGMSLYVLARIYNQVRTEGVSRILFLAIPLPLLPIKFFTEVVARFVLVPAATACGCAAGIVSFTLGWIVPATIVLAFHQVPWIVSTVLLVYSAESTWFEIELHNTSYPGGVPGQDFAAHMSLLWMNWTADGADRAYFIGPSSLYDEDTMLEFKHCPLDLPYCPTKLNFLHATFFSIVTAIVVGALMGCVGLCVIRSRWSGGLDGSYKHSVSTSWWKAGYFFFCTWCLTSAAVTTAAALWYRQQDERGDLSLEHWWDYSAFAWGFALVAYAPIICCCRRYLGMTKHRRTRSDGYTELDDWETA